MGDAEQVEATVEDVECPEWVSAYAIGLSAAGIGPHAIARRLAGLRPTPTDPIYHDAIVRTRSLVGLDSRLRWTALVALRLASSRRAPVPR